MSVNMPQPLVWRIGSPRAPQMPASAHIEMRLAAEFATLAARSEVLPVLEHEICRVAAEGLRVKFAKLLVYDADERTFLLQAGVGWRDGIVRRTRLDADVGTAAGFAWQSGRSIISNDLRAEPRFRVPSILAEHGIVRSINVVVPGDAEAAYGVLEVESPDPGRFTEHDVSFLQLLAQSLAAAIGRIGSRTLHDEQTHQSDSDHRTSLHELQHRIRNDLQVLCSVIDRERRCTSDLEALIGFGRIGRRVMAVAGLYDHLLGHGGREDVDMGIYLGSLCEKIARAADLPFRNIVLKADLQTLMLPIGQAVRLAVAINELVTNAVEHAFPDGMPGTIEIGLTAAPNDGDGSPSIRVSDDGCGFNGPRIGSAGLVFVAELAHQAGGTLAREEAQGTSWRIRLASRARSS